MPKRASPPYKHIALLLVICVLLMCHRKTDQRQQSHAPAVTMTNTPTPATLQTQPPLRETLDDEVQKLTAEYEAAGRQLKIVSSNWHWTEAHDGALWALVIQNTGDHTVEAPGFITKYADRYGNVLEVNDSNYRKRDVVRVVVKPHERKNVRFQEDFSQPVSILKATQGTIRIDGASWSN